jgi:hypothetical protein
MVAAQIPQRLRVLVRRERKVWKADPMEGWKPSQPAV